jgi:hypothetical protein
MDAFECESITKGDIFIDCLAACKSNQVAKVKAHVRDYPFVVSAFWTGQVSAPPSRIAKCQLDTAFFRNCKVSIPEHLVKSLDINVHQGAYSDEVLFALGMPPP